MLTRGFRGDLWNGLFDKIATISLFKPEANFCASNPEAALLIKQTKAFLNNLFGAGEISRRDLSIENLLRFRCE